MANFDSLFSVATPSTAAWDKLITAPAMRKKVFGSQPVSTLTIPDDPSSVAARQQLMPIANAISGTVGAVADDPGDAVRAAVDLALMGTGDLYNKAGAGYSGIAAMGGTLAGGGSLDEALQTGTEAIQAYKAPEGPARAIQERPRSKALEAAFAPLGQAVTAGANFASDYGVAPEFTQGAAEAAFDFMMGKHGLNRFAGTQPGLTVQPFYSALERAVQSDKLPGKKQSILPFLKKQGVTDAEIVDTGLFDFLKSVPGEKVSKEALLDHLEGRGPKLSQSVYSEALLNDMRYLDLQDQLRQLTQRMLEFRQDRATPENQVNGRLPLREARQIPEYKEWEAQQDALINEMESVRRSQPVGLPKYSSYKAIDSTEGVVPNSYTEEFVTLKDPYDMKHWGDEHGGYESTANPLIRLRYDVKEYPDGRRTMRIHEIQDPKAVREARDPDVQSDVPNSLATRAMDIGAKKAIARAKELGVDGIEWSTGTQQMDLYNNALRGVADEARWNPETQELQIYKNGSRVMKDQLPDKVPKEKIADYIGEAGAKRLLESSVKSTMGPDDIKLAIREYGLSPALSDFMDNFSPQEKAWWESNRGRSLEEDYSMVDRAVGGFAFNRDLEDFIVKHALDKNSGLYDTFKHMPIDDMGYHTATDLSIDAKWPRELYGDFEGATPVAKIDWVSQPFDDGVYFGQYGDKGFTISAQDNGTFTIDEHLDSGSTNYDVKIAHSLEEAKQWAQDQIAQPKMIEPQYELTEIPDVSFEDGFDVEPGDRVWVPADGATGNVYNAYVHKPAEADYYSAWASGTNFVGNFPTLEAADQAIKAKLSKPAPPEQLGEYKHGLIGGMLKKYGKGETGTASNQPVMWFTDKTPSSFPIYEGVTGIVSMLQEQVAKNGGGAKGVMMTAAKVGVPAALLAKFMSSDDETRKKMLALPMMAGLLSPAINYKGNVIKGKEFETHSRMVTKSGLDHNLVYDHGRKGFVNESGKFIDRDNAIDYIKQNEPELYPFISKLERNAGQLTSEGYRAARRRYEQSTK